MTLSAPAERTLREPLARLGDPPSRRVARIAAVTLYPILYDDGRHAGIDGPLIAPVAAPVVATS